MIALAYGIAGAVLVLTAAWGVRMLRVLVIDDLSDEEMTTRSEKSPGVVTYLIDSTGSVTQRLLFAVYGRSRVERLAQTLRVAGNPEGLTPAVFIQREAGFMTLGLGLCAIFALNGWRLLGIVIGLLFCVWMHAWLFLVVKARTAQIERDLPDFLDVFAVTVAAGLPFRVAMDRVAEYHSGPLAEELRTTLREMQLGVPRRSALERMRERSRSNNVATFVTALLQAEELGTPLAEALQDISAEVRRERAQQIRQAATKAQPKVSMVVTMTIVPGVIVLVLGGMLVMNMDALSGLFADG